MIALIATLTDARADQNVQWCLEIATNYTDAAGGDLWTTNANRKARGARLVITKSGQPFFDGEVDADGCKTVFMPSGSYQIINYFTGEVNGVPIEVRGATGSYPINVIAGSGWSPDSSDGTETVVIPADVASGLYAIAATTMHSSNLGLGSADTLYYVYDGGCCSFVDGEIFADTSSKTRIGYLTGLAIGYLRDNDAMPSVDLNAAENNCDGDGEPQSQMGQVTKEYQSAAAVGGFAALISAWMWNDEAQFDCILNRHYNSDFDLDGADDNAGNNGGQTECDDIPDPDCNPGPCSLASYVTATDWLEDLVNAADPNGCTGTLTYRSTELDWLRYGWDMLTNEGVPIRDYVDIYDASNPRTWDPDDNAIGSAGSLGVDDDPVFRWVNAADGEGYLTDHDNQDHNGQDH